MGLALVYGAALTYYGVWYARTGGMPPHQEELERLSHPRLLGGRCSTVDLT